MNIHTGTWDFQLGRVFGLEPELLASTLPEIYPSVHHYVTVMPGLAIGGLPITGVLVYQQAERFGQIIFSSIEYRNTYGTCGLILSIHGYIPEQTNNIHSMT